jgi:hypothetical protein
MTQLPLHFREKHLFIEINGQYWLVDTGAPTTLGSGTVSFNGGAKHKTYDRLYTLTIDHFLKYIPIEFVGVLGMDVLHNYDFIFDIPGSKVTISVDDLNFPGHSVPTGLCLNSAPVVVAEINRGYYPMIFDTGAPVSYWLDDKLTKFPLIGEYQDFFPLSGWFKTNLYKLGVKLNSRAFVVQCGRTLPDLLDMSLKSQNIEGLIGSEVLTHGPVAFFPRRQEMVL